jgi:hypothetical protein
MLHRQNPSDSILCCVTRLSLKVIKDLIMFHVKEDTNRNWIRTFRFEIQPTFSGIYSYFTRSAVCVKKMKHQAMITYGGVVV